MRSCRSAKATGCSCCTVRARACILQLPADKALAGDTVVDDYSIPAADAPAGRAEQGDEAAKPSRVRDRRLAGDAASATSALGNSQAPSALTTQDLAAAFASFAAVGATATPAASTASIVAPRRSADAGACAERHFVANRLTKDCTGLGEMRSASPLPATPAPVLQNVQPGSSAPSATLDDSAAQASYMRMLADWNAQQDALAATVRARCMRRAMPAGTASKCHCSHYS